MLPLGDSASHCAFSATPAVSAAMALALVNLANALLNVPDAFKLVVTSQAPRNVSYPMAARSWAQLSRLLSTAISDQPSLGNSVPAFVCAGCVCNAKESSDAFTCQVQQENISSLLDQAAQRLRWSIYFCGLLASPSKSCDSGVLVFENRAWTNVSPISVGSAGTGEGFV